ncbi:MAG: amidohydrolase family protein [Deltaproteobacteria bacterium]|nr:amidohydrolase family protein [Deltaproteobacteria bacterium]
MFLALRAEFLLPMTESRLRIRDGYVLAQGDRLLEVGPWTPEVAARLGRLGDRLVVPGTPDRRPLPGPGLLPMRKAVLMPGFVKAHGHDDEQLLIGVARDEPLADWLDHAVNPLARYLRDMQERLTEDLGCTPWRAAYRMARLCDVHYGITSSLIHHCHANKVRWEDLALANEEAGTSMIIAIGSQDRHYAAEILDRPEDALSRLDRAWARRDAWGATTVCPGPDQAFSNSRALLVPQKAWARAHGTLFHLHASEEPRTTAWFQAEVEPGHTPVEYLESIGVLDPRTLLAHQVHCGPRDLEILARHGVGIVHNPLANTILGSGMPPVVEMLAAGIRVALSTDGSGSADHQNMLAAARLASRYQKARLQDASVLPAGEVLEMITRIPAEILGMDTGVLAPGMRADFLLVDLTAPNLVPTRIDNLVENLVWASDGNEIDTVVARGRLLKEGGRVLPLRDGTRPEAIVAAAEHLSEGFATWRATAPEVRGTGAHR